MRRDNEAIFKDLMMSLALCHNVTPIEKLIVYNYMHISDGERAF